MNEAIFQQTMGEQLLPDNGQGRWIGHGNNNLYIPPRSPILLSMSFSHRDP